MVIKINPLSIIDEQQEVIPGAAQHAETYLRVLAKKVQELGPPVTMDLEAVQPHRGISGGQRLCLILRPTERRLKNYPLANYAVPMGAALNVGLWLLGGEYQDGRSIGIGRIGAVSDTDVSDILAIRQMVTDYAVVPAMNEIADLSSGGPIGGPPNPSGFFGS